MWKMKEVKIIEIFCHSEKREESRINPRKSAKEGPNESIIMAHIVRQDR